MAYDANSENAGGNPFGNLRRETIYNIVNPCSVAVNYVATAFSDDHPVCSQRVFDSVSEMEHICKVGMERRRPFCPDAQMNSRGVLD